jgi:enoyl-CoA hydratase/carnithine racemase
MRIYESHFPIIAKIDGPAVGAGANLAIAYDFKSQAQTLASAFFFDKSA